MAADRLNIPCGSRPCCARGECSLVRHGHPLIRSAQCLVVFRATAYFRELSIRRTIGVLPIALGHFRRFGISALFGIVVRRAGGAVDRHPVLLLPPPSRYISPAALGGGRLSHRFPRLGTGRPPGPSGAVSGRTGRG